MPLTVAVCNDMSRHTNWKTPESTASSGVSSQRLPLRTRQMVRAIPQTGPYPLFPPMRSLGANGPSPGMSPRSHSWYLPGEGGGKAAPLPPRVPPPLRLAAWWLSEGHKAERGTGGEAEIRLCPERYRAFFI